MRLLWLGIKACRRQHCALQANMGAPHVWRKLINAYCVAGISRDSLHKRRATGGRKKTWRKKKK